MLYVRVPAIFPLSPKPKPVNILEPENLDIESIFAAPRKAVEQTVEPIGIDESKSLGEKLFPFLDAQNTSATRSMAPPSSATSPSASAWRSAS
jgi:hypothetical protein